MSVPLVVDRNRGPIEALGESWENHRRQQGQPVHLLAHRSGAEASPVLARAGVGLLLVVPILCIAWFYIYLRLTGSRWRSVQCGRIWDERQRRVRRAAAALIDSVSGLTGQPAAMAVRAA